MDDVIAGRNPVIEALKSRRPISKILLQRGERQGSVQVLVAMAREQSIPLQEVDRARLDELCGGVRHQGVAAYVAAKEFSSLDDILNLATQKRELPFLLLLDELEDPHNVGALLRSAECAGVHGVLLPKRRSAGLTPIVHKTSAGAVEYVPVAQIGNVSQTIVELQKRGLWVVAADAGGDRAYFDVDLTMPLVIVVGGEGRGIGRLVKERCDLVVNIPMKGEMNSLNASVAGSLLLYEVLRQREMMNHA